MGMFLCLVGGGLVGYNLKSEPTSLFLGLLGLFLAIVGGSLNGME